MNLILFVIVIIVSFIAVRIGAVAFELTGLDWSLAKFQALSCFTGTGFTTREAELITGNRQRRRIASVLMVLGNAGLVTLIATFANSLRPATHLSKFTVPFVHMVFHPRLLPLVNLTVMAVSIYIVYRFFTHARFTKKMSRLFKERLIRNKLVKPVSFEELLVVTGGYGILSLAVDKDTLIIDKTLRESKLREYGINVLVLERQTEVIPNPSSDTKIIMGDRLTCFGKLEEVKTHLYKPRTLKDDKG